MTVIPLVALVLTALVHLVPASVLFRREGVKTLYGSDAMTPELMLLLRHRAAGFAMLAAMSIAALFVEQWRAPVLLFALGSVVSFVILWFRSGVRTPALDRVAYTDLALTPFIAAGLALA